MKAYGTCVLTITADYMTDLDYRPIGVYDSARSLPKDKEINAVMSGYSGR